MPSKIISLKKIHELDLGREFVEEVIGVYIEEIPQYLKMAQENFDTEKRIELKRVIHTLKSHSSMLDMHEIGLKLARWEDEALTAPLSSFEADFNLEGLYFAPPAWFSRCFEAPLLVRVHEGRRCPDIIAVGTGDAKAPVRSPGRRHLIEFRVGI